jgi:hypothetical protein
VSYSQLHRKLHRISKLPSVTPSHPLKNPSTASTARAGPPVRPASPDRAAGPSDRWMALPCDPSCLKKTIGIAQRFGWLPNENEDELESK